MRRKVLVAEPDAKARESLAASLASAGFEVTAVNDGLDALRHARKELFSMLVTEVDLPEIDGFDLCRELKRDLRTARVPIIFATRRNDDIDRIIGLEIGAEDYVAKPCNVRELILRMKRALGRIEETEFKPARLAIGELILDRGRGKCWAEGREIHLTAQEFKLLSLLMERQGTVQSHQQILREAWQYDVFSNSRTLHTHVRRLRIKLGNLRHYIENVRDMGYRLRELELGDHGAGSFLDHKAAAFAVAVGK